MSEDLQFCLSFFLVVSGFCLIVITSTYAVKNLRSSRHEV